MPILYILLRFAQSRIAFLIVFAAIGAFCIGTTVGIVIFVPDPPLADPYRDVIRPGELMHFTAVGTTLSILAMGIGSIINVGATYVAIYFLAGIEFIVRRIAENPKGPFLTMSVTLGAIAALLKAFS